MERPRVVIAGVSTRAIAQSAARAGYPVCAVDAFGDLDHPGAPVISLARDLGRPFTAAAAAGASRALPGSVAVYVSNFENHPRAVDALARERTLWGNPPPVLERARNPVHVARLLRARGFATPEVRAHPPAPGEAAATCWLAKPRASGGGHGIGAWQPGQLLPPGYVLQQCIIGVPASLAFAANGRRAMPFAISRQLVGDRAFGAEPFRYCGSILSSDPGAGVAGSPSVLSIAADMAHALAEELGLVGVNGLDFIIRDGVPYPIEVNPRHSASMELAERAFDLSVFETHALACQGTLPRFELAAALRDVGAVGKAVLYARRTVTLGDTRGWLERDDVHDVPHPGERIERGRPVCTIFAHGRTDDECHAALVRRALALYEEIEQPPRRAA